MQIFQLRNHGTDIRFNVRGLYQGVFFVVDPIELQSVTKSNSNFNFFFPKQNRSGKFRQQEFKAQNISFYYR
jgi:hypothetical protein